MPQLPKLGSLPAFLDFDVVYVGSVTILSFMLSLLQIRLKLRQLRILPLEILLHPPKSFQLSPLNQLKFLCLLLAL